MPFSPHSLLPWEASSNAGPRPARDGDVVPRIPDPAFLPVLQNSCQFGPDVFEQVSLNTIKNPNLNSSHLFRADILYDSLGGECTNLDWPEPDLQRLRQQSALADGAFPGYSLRRTLIRQMVPRNPQIDRPIAQTCHLLRSTETRWMEQNLIVCIPLVSSVEEIPWYHPAVKSLAYLHSWNGLPESTASTLGSAIALEPEHRGIISLHYELFPSQPFPLPSRLLRTAHHLLAVLHKHGEGVLAGYTKRVHHDQLISQQRVQDTYTELKRKHAKRLCDMWVEQTESSKHVFEDLGIAAFLIELWKDMYLPPSPDRTASEPQIPNGLPPFPGFVDIGCVLTEVLRHAGYSGWGCDARRRKTWSILSPATQANLHELVLIPRPFFDLPLAAPDVSNMNIFSRAISTLRPSATTLHVSSKLTWHNGMFPKSTFLISNHADELTPWTPLLASLSQSPFLAIPCCSHNLSGPRFRAPSVFNSQTADHLAPAFFASNKRHAKSVAITIATNLDYEDDDCRSPTVSRPSAQAGDHPGGPPRPEAGDLKALSPAARAKQPSAYSSLCDWVAHLASEVGYVVEREALRIPSTRNVGILGRSFRPDPTPSSGDNAAPQHAGAPAPWLAPALPVTPPPSPSLYGAMPTPPESAKSRSGASTPASGAPRQCSPLPYRRNASTPNLELQLGQAEAQARMERVLAIARREGADGRVWIERCKALTQGKGKGKEKGAEKGHG
jgi:tRNASer (uridine44-2'-O)-methyltransferase